jgi:hypothetical protein
VYYYDYAEWRAVFENASVGSFVKPPRVIKSRDETRSQPPRSLNLHVFAQSTARSKFGDKCGVEVRADDRLEASFFLRSTYRVIVGGNCATFCSRILFPLTTGDTHFIGLNFLDNHVKLKCQRLGFDPQKKLKYLISACCKFFVFFIKMFDNNVRLNIH